MDLKVHFGARTKAFVGEDRSTDAENMTPVSALRFCNDGGDDLSVQMVVVSAGIKPRDELVRDAGTVALGERGGIVVDEQMRTSADGIYAIEEVTLYRNFIYGLILPGYDLCFPELLRDKLVHMGDVPRSFLPGTVAFKRGGVAMSVVG